jgi:nucleoside-diphosphate-sugar epimerase
VRSVKVLVTGGGGFIGSHLVDRLLADGHDVCVLDNFATGRRENVAHVLGDIELIEGDLQSYERAATAVRGCEVVLHQGALPSVPRSVQDPLTSNAVNVIGTLNLLLAARDSGVRRVVYASSSSVYGHSPRLPKTEDLQTLPASPYAVAKLAGEGYCRSFHSVYGLETVSLRYFNVFGTRQNPFSQYAAVIPAFIMAALAGQRPTIYGDGQQSRDFTYVDNVVDANVRAMDASEAPGRAVNVACGERITLNRVIDELREILGREIEPRYEAARAGDIKHSLASVELAEELLGYRPAVGFRDGLTRTAQAWLVDPRSATAAPA